jgi:Fe2+ or Zn2+ uptake regulation protein
MNHDDQFKSQLRAAGERVTAPRLGIYRALLRHAPLPMSQLIDRAKADGIDPVTTYRTVDLFRRLGFIQEVGMGRRRLYELSTGHQAHHHHFTCTTCGRITDFDSEAIEMGLHQAGDRLGLDIRSHQLEATGICGGCRV